MTVGQRIKQARKAAGLSVAKLAKAAGMGASTVYDLERGDQTSTAKLASIAAATDVSAYWLETGKTPKDRPNKSATPDFGSDIVEPGPTIGGMSTVPIVGTTQGGPDRQWIEEGRPVGYGDQYLDAPCKDASAYALRVKGTSMHPRIKEGEVVLVSPQTEPMASDEVVVCLNDGNVMVKELVYRRAGEMALDSVSADEPRIVIQEDQVEFIHTVIGTFRPSSIRQR